MSDGLTMDGWWFCAPGGVEEIRFHTDPRTLRPVAVTLKCGHGAWTGDSDEALSQARHAHGYTFSPPPPKPELRGYIA